MYEINVTRFKEANGNVLGLAQLRFNEQFVVNNIRIMESKQDEIFVSMPSYRREKRDKNGELVKNDNGEPVYEYKPYANPTTKEFREELYSAILALYEKGGGREKYALEEVEKISFDGYFNPYTREGSKICGMVNVKIAGKFAVNALGVYQNEKNNYHMITMPSYKTNKQDKDGKPIYKEICLPIEKEFSKALYGVINEAAKTNEWAHFNEKGIIPETEERKEQAKSSTLPEQEQEMSANDFMDVPDEMMNDLPFMFDSPEDFAAVDGSEFAVHPEIEKNMETKARQQHKR